MVLKRAMRAPTAINFSYAFCEAQSYLGMTDRQLANLCGVSQAVIVKWALGQSAPHPLGRIPILRWMKAEVEAKPTLAQ